MPETTDIPDVLARICAYKHDEVARARAALPEPDVAAAAPARPVAIGPGHPFGVIAEVKRASPSAGAIAPGADAKEQACVYAAAGAAAVSVLTDGPSFGGSLDDLRRVRAAVDVPLLRKDFTVDAYQVDEARAAGADIVLVIVAALPPDRVLDFCERTRRLGMLPLVEVHGLDELPVGLEAVADGGVLGVNARNLRSLEVDLRCWERVAEAVPAGVVRVAESGIRTTADAQRARAAGYHGVLCGEALMRAGDPAAFVAELAER